jgi:rfaE bifunctional protein nucleotidyltransferase chain/domain
MGDMGEVVSLETAVSLRRKLKAAGKKVVFTNGTFDILHRGHIEYLKKAREMGDALFVGLNSDESVRIIKGEGRPIMTQEDRAFLLANLVCVDIVVIFTESTPIHLIRALLPDVLVKGADWLPDNIVGKDVVESHGGNVVTVELTPDRSSSSVIETILNRAAYFKKM